MIIAHEIALLKPEGKSSCRRYGGRWEDNMKMNTNVLFLDITPYP
jgi:hypothetical protein